MLIRTKLRAPSLRSRLLHRKELINRLNTAEDYPFILVSGPAGSGKTSLVCQWIKGACSNVAWYSLDQEDNEPDLFFRYFLAAFIEADKEFNESLGPMLVKQQQLTGDFVIPLIIDTLTEANRKISLIIDDFHHIENKHILNAVALLINYIPANLQLVILSRYSLPAAIDAVAIKKERLEITASDLKFTETETVSLFREVIPIPISTEQIGELNRCVEGWAAGLQLIGLEIRSRGGEFKLSDVLNKAQEQVASFLIHDILLLQPEKIRNFIYTTALLDRFNPDVSAELTGQKEAGRILASLERMNLFLIPQEGPNQWYRYHNMFSEVVRRQISVDEPVLVLSTLLKAAKWFAENNHIEDAMRNAFRSGDLEFAADLMEDHIIQYVEKLNPTAGLRWITRLPLEVLRKRILLGLYQCQFLMILTEFSKIREILTTIEILSDKGLERYTNDKRRLCEDYIIFYKCMLEILQDAQSADIYQLEVLSKKISPQNNFLGTALEFYSVNVLIAKGDLTKANTLLERVFKLLAPLDLFIKRIYFDEAKCIIARLRGRLHQAKMIIRQSQQELSAQGMHGSPMEFILYRHLGYIFYLQNRLDEARECADLAVRYCEYSYIFNEMMASSELQLLLHLAAGEKEEAAECIHQLRIYAVKLGMPQFSAGIDACAARVALEQGNLATAVLWSSRRHLSITEPFSLLFAMECLTQASLYHAQGKFPEAGHLLDVLRDRCFKRDLMELVLQIDILRSATLHALNQQKKAKSILVEALGYSEADGYVRPFVNHAEGIAPILRDISQDLPYESFPSHLKKIFKVCHISIRPPAKPNDTDTVPHRNLTHREIEILELIARGFKNKDIANKESISISTVKTHVHRILSKLAVQTRTQAIIKAKEMDIMGRG